MSSNTSRKNSQKKEQKQTQIKFVVEEIQIKDDDAPKSSSKLRPAGDYFQWQNITKATPDMIFQAKNTEDDDDEKVQIPKPKQQQQPPSSKPKADGKSTAGKPAPSKGAK